MKTSLIFLQEYQNHVMSKCAFIRQFNITSVCAFIISESAAVIPSHLEQGT